jgi:excisionase family DNA binding protein
MARVALWMLVFNREYIHEPTKVKGRNRMARLKSVNETARTLGVSPLTVRRFIKAGSLRSVRVGKRVLLSEKELARVMAQGVEPSNSFSPNAKG